MRRNNKSKLCCFGSLDYMILASTLAIALGEELEPTEISILASFLAVLSDELALVGALEACESGNSDDDVFIAPVPDVAITTPSPNKKRKTKKVIKKRIKKRKKA